MGVLYNPPSYPLMGGLWYITGIPINMYGYNIYQKYRSSFFSWLDLKSEMRTRHYQDPNSNDDPRLFCSNRNPRYTQKRSKNQSIILKPEIKL